jgi:hypothetical protein
MQVDKARRGPDVGELACAANLERLEGRADVATAAQGVVVLDVQTLPGVV